MTEDVYDNPLDEYLQKHNQEIVEIMYVLFEGCKVDEDEIMQFLVDCLDEGKEVMKSRAKEVIARKLDDLKAKTEVKE